MRCTESDQHNHLPCGTRAPALRRVAARAALIASVLVACLGAPASADAAAKCAAPSQLPVVPGDTSGMVFIPAGAFAMGSERNRPEERSTHLVRVDGFWIDTHEVTNAEFAAFVKATGYVTQAERQRGLDPASSTSSPGPGVAVFVSPADLSRGGDITQWWRFIEGANWRHPEGPDTSIEGRENHPVVDVTYEDALAYANWRGHDLPTEAEWEYASRGGSTAEAPSSEAYENGKPVANTWQGIFPVLNTEDDGYTGTAPVGCFKPNGYGLYDMIGNVWEWTKDWYRPGHDSTPALNPSGPTAPVRFDPTRAPSKVIKGGSYLCAYNFCARYRSTARQPQEADLGTAHIGFRTVLRKPAAGESHARSEASGSR